MTTKTNDGAAQAQRNLPAAPATASGAVDSLVAMCEERFTPVLGRENGSIDWGMFALGVRAACLKNPKLVPAIQQNPAPLIQALSQAASLGLSPHPDLHHFYLVPFKGEITALIGYRGLIELAMRSGLVEDIQGFVIYRDEVAGLKAACLPLIDPVSGEPNVHPDNRLLDGVTRADDDIVGAIAIVRAKGRARPITRTMTRDEIEKRRRAGQGNTPAWLNWYPEQCVKTVLRAVLRSGRVPLGTQAEAVRRATEEEIRSAEVIEPARPQIGHHTPKQIDHHPDETARRHEDPFPDPEAVRAELVDDVRRAMEMAGTDEEQLAVIIDGLGLPADVDWTSMGPRELRAVLGAILGDEPEGGAS